MGRKKKLLSYQEHRIPSTKPGLFVDGISMVNNLSMIQGLFEDGILKQVQNDTYLIPSFNTAQPMPHYSSLNS